jgi:hypothetical protein
MECGRLARPAAGRAGGTPTLRGTGLTKSAEQSHRVGYRRNDLKRKEIFMTPALPVLATTSALAILAKRPKHPFFIERIQRLTKTQYATWLCARSPPPGVRDVFRDCPI